MTARGSALRFKALGADTDRRFSLFEREVPVGARRPAAHRHPGTSEAFYVLDGTLAMRLGDENLAVHAGTFVCVPPGVVHAFSNPRTAPVRFLNFNTPAGWEGYMRDLAAAAAGGRQLSTPEIAANAARHDFHPA